MYPKPIAQYFAPSSLAEGLALRAAHPEGVLLAGGQSLVPRMKARQVAPDTLIDLNRIEELSAVTVSTAGIRLGALVRHRAAATHPGLRAHAAVLADAAYAIGDLQVRNRGTLIGNLCFGDPTGDIAPAAMALGAHLRIESAARGARLLPVSGFDLTTLRADEIVTHLEFLTTSSRVAGAFLKYGRAAQDRAIVSAAVHLSLDLAERVTQAAIVIGGVLPGAQLARAASRALVGQRFEAGMAHEAGETAAQEIVTQDDSMASAAYRSRLLALLVAGALVQALGGTAVGATR